MLGFSPIAGDPIASSGASAAPTAAQFASAAIAQASATANLSVLGAVAAQFAAVAIAQASAAASLTAPGSAAQFAATAVAQASAAADLLAPARPAAALLAAAAIARASAAADLSVHNFAPSGIRTWRVATSQTFAPAGEFTLRQDRIPEARKTAAEILDYTLDFSDEVSADDEIVSYSVTRTGVVRITQSVRRGTAVTFWLAGGGAGYTTMVDCDVTTLAGRVISASMAVAVVARK